MKENSDIFMGNAFEKIKENLKSFEKVSEHYLMRNMPIIVRIDGKNFRHLTRGLEKPFDPKINEIMRETLISLCRNVKGVVMGYTISDEIDLLIYDADIYWYDYNLQGVVASIASLVTGHFNRYYHEKMQFADANKRVALFDVVAFNLPPENVSDYFIEKQNYEMRVALEEYTSLKSPVKGLGKLDDFGIKKKLFHHTKVDYDRDISMHNRLGLVAKLNDSNDYSIMKKTPIFEEVPAFLSGLVDIPLYNIELDMEEE